MVVVDRLTTRPLICCFLSDAYRSAEDDLVLDCKVQGVPTPTITWMKDNVPIDMSDDRLLSAKLPNGVWELQIHNPSKRDSGTYACIAENGSGIHKTQHRVMFTQPERIAIDLTAREEEKKIPKGKKKEKGKVGTGIPKAKASLTFHSFLTSRTLPDTKPVKLSCFVVGPDPIAKWTKNGGTVAASATVKQTNTDGLLSLQLLTPTVADSGEYEVTVKNAAGSISSRCQLTIYSTKISADFPPMFTRALKGKY